MQLSEILGKHRYKTKPLVTNDPLDAWDKGRELKKAWSSPERAKKYREINVEVRRGMDKANEK